MCAYRPASLVRSLDRQHAHHIRFDSLGAVCQKIRTHQSHGMAYESCVSKHRLAKPNPTFKVGPNLVQTVDVIHFCSVSQKCHLLINNTRECPFLELLLTYRGSMDSLCQPRIWNAELGLCPVDSGLDGSSCPLYAQYLRCKGVRNMASRKCPLQSISINQLIMVPTCAKCHFLAMPNSEKAGSTNWSQTLVLRFQRPTTRVGTSVFRLQMTRLRRWIHLNTLIPNLPINNYIAFIIFYPMMLLLAATRSPIFIGILSSPADNAIPDDLGCQRSMNLQTCQMCSIWNWTHRSLFNESAIWNSDNGNGHQIDLVPSLPSINGIVLYNHLPPRWLKCCQITEVQWTKNHMGDTML